MRWLISKYPKSFEMHISKRQSQFDFPLIKFFYYLKIRSIYHRPKVLWSINFLFEKNPVLETYPTYLFSIQAQFSSNTGCWRWPSCVEGIHRQSIRIASQQTSK